MTVIKEMRMGPYRFRNIPVFVFNDTFNLTSYPYLSGIIGNDILRRFNTILNYSKREFYFMPNSHYQDNFDYAYSGVELYMIDGKIILGDVANGSPAESAGLKEGDEVIGINNILGKNLQLFKSALQQQGEKIRMIVNRDGDLMEFTFKIKSIL
jgi:predicted metalloprotease with PDZ domain